MKMFRICLIVMSITSSLYAAEYGLENHVLYKVIKGQKIESKYPNGSTKEIYYVKKDSKGNLLKHGKYISFHENGMKWMEVNYKYDQIQKQTWNEWDENGMILQKAKKWYE